MNNSHPISTVVLLFYLAAHTCCTSTTPKADAMHYSESMLQDFKKICNKEQNRDTGMYLLDSVYKTFPYISVADKYRYYNFEQQLFEMIRFGKQSYDTAIIYVDSMIAVIEDNELQKAMHSEYAKAFSIRGEYFNRRAKYSEAIKDISYSKLLNKEAGDSCIMAENTRTLSIIAIKQSDFILAANLMKEALDLAASCNNDQYQFFRMQRCLDDLGFIYFSSANYDSALHYHFAAANYVLNNRMLMAEDTIFPYTALENIYQNISTAYFKQNNYAEAELYLKKAMLIDETILHKKVPLAQAQYLLGNIYLITGRINEAEEMAQKSVVHENKFDLVAKSQLIKLQADIANAKQQYKKVATYRLEQLIIKDSISKGEIEVLKKNPFAEYESLDRKYQLDLLKKDNRIQQNKTTAAIAIGILLTLLAIISFFLVWRLRTVMRKRAVAYKKLAASERDLTITIHQKEIAEKQLREKELFSQEMRLQMEFNKAIIEQRRQISDDMHDALSSSLAALKFYVEDVKNRAEGTAAQKTLTDIEDEVGSVYQNARSYMHSLKTNNWETPFSLIGFLKEIQQKFAEKKLMQIKLNLEEDKIKTILSTQQHDQLYHIIKESISNVIKHASALQVVITILFTDSGCQFSVADNGKGFQKDNHHQGIGIKSMTKRANELGGVLNIDSTPIGTTIKGYFPIY